MSLPDPRDFKGVGQAGANRCRNVRHLSTHDAAAAEAVDRVVASDGPCMSPPMGVLLDIPISDTASL